MIKPMITGHNRVTNSIIKLTGGSIGLGRGKEIIGVRSEVMTTPSSPKATTSASIRWSKWTCNGGVSSEGIG